MKGMKATLLAVACVCWLHGTAQLGPVELHPEWGQAGWSNPALLHPSGGHVLIGGLAGVNAELGHTGPTYSDFISGEGLVDPTAFLESMDPTESIGTRSEVPLISFGFRDEQRFEFRLRSRFVAEQQFDYDRDLFDLALRGNGHPDNIGRPISLGGMAMNAQGYFDHGLSVGAMAKEDKLWLGWGIHILNGVAAFQTDAFDATWTTDTLDYSWDLTGEAAFYAAGADLDSLISGGDVGLPSFDSLPNTLGSGVAFDFGFLWRLSEKVSLEGAVEGRGGMRWLESVSSVKVDPSEFVLEGIDVVGEWGASESLSPDSISEDLDTWIEGMVDSLEAAFGTDAMQGLPAAFDSRVRETWRVGLHIQPAEGLDVQLMAYRQLRFGQTRDGALIGVTYRVRNNIAMHGQAQYFNGGWIWGAGLSLRGGPLRISASAGNVPGVFYPLESGYWQGQAGISFDMGYAKQKKKKRRKGDLGTGAGMWH